MQHLEPLSVTVFRLSQQTLRVMPLNVRLLYWLLYMTEDNNRSSGLSERSYSESWRILTWTWICCSDACCTAAASCGEIWVDVTCTYKRKGQPEKPLSFFLSWYTLATMTSFCSYTHSQQLIGYSRVFVSYWACQLEQRPCHLRAVGIDAVGPLLVHHGSGGATGLLAELLKDLGAFGGQRLQELLHAVLGYGASLLAHILVERDRTAFDRLIHDRSIHLELTEAWKKDAQKKRSKTHF